MTLWLCRTCMNEFPDTEAPPTPDAHGNCPICADDRQYLPPDGQAWTHADELAAEGCRCDLTEVEADLFALTTDPKAGIGQRGLLLRTPAGNLLWEPPGHLDDAAFSAVTALGPVAVIGASHPHLVGASVAWSHRLAEHQGSAVDILKHAKDARWITRPYPVIKQWSGTVGLLPGVRLLDAGGHFPGSSLVHWADGADGRGVLLTGDTIAIGADRCSVNVMRSYVNNIPLPQPAVQRIADTVAPLTYDRIYSAFGLLPTQAKRIVELSLDRYIRWLRADVDDY